MSLYRRLQDRFGSAGVVLGIIALTLALGGTALAAKGALTGKQKKEVETIAKKYAGKPGAPGATGPAGTAGPAGPAGPKGDTGAKGDTGTQGNPGTPGAAGKSVVLSAEAKGANCADGGTKVEVEGNAASKKYVCNGTTGFTKTLPSGATETGTFALYQSLPAASAATEEQTTTWAPISFSIPLAQGSGEEKVFVLSPEQIENEEGPGFEAGCTGTAFEPTAPSGVLCVYTAENNSSNGFIFFANQNEEPKSFGPAGTVLWAQSSALPATVQIRGTWAVTAP
ncbi:MAG: collagen-like protein [Solirubrobacterales bacterium]